MKSIMVAEQAIEHDGRGRFQSGCSGNPSGALNQATRLRALLEDGEERANARVVIDRALGGNLAPSASLMDRLDPEPRSRPVPLEPRLEVEIDSTCDAGFRQMAAGGVRKLQIICLWSPRKGQRDGGVDGA
jgi:hypothetical protein